VSKRLACVCPALNTARPRRAWSTIVREPMPSHSPRFRSAGGLAWLSIARLCPVPLAPWSWKGAVRNCQSTRQNGRFLHFDHRTHTDNPQDSARRIYGDIR